MSKSEGLWAALCDLEAARSEGDPVAVVFASDLMWPGLVWNRELLLNLRGVDFRGILLALSTELRKFFSSWSTAKVIDDGVNIKQILPTTTTSNKHSCNELYSQLVNSRWLEEFDRPLPPESQTCRSSAVSQQLMSNSKRLHNGHIESSSLRKTMCWAWGALGTSRRRRRSGDYKVWPRCVCCRRVGMLQSYGACTSGVSS